MIRDAMAVHNGSTTIRNTGRAIIRNRGPKARIEETIIGNDGNLTNVKSRKLQTIEKIPSLKEFIHVQKVKHQYRDFLRATKNITDPVFQNQAMNEIRQSYASVKNDSDSLSISMAFQEGERKLKEFKSMVGYVDQRTTHRKDIVDEDSWLNIKDPADPRGRVGTVWPWQREGKDS